MPPLRFLTFLNPALANNSSARAERVPPLQNTTISSAESNSLSRPANLDFASASRRTPARKVT